MRRLTGTTDRVSVAGESVDAFVPFPLPPADDRKRDRAWQFTRYVALLREGTELGD